MVAISLCALLMRLAPGPEILDDAYITYRIARNVAAGDGWVYNPGERVQSSTTQAYTLLLSVLPKLGLDLPSGSFVLNAFFGGITSLLLFLAGRKIGGDGRVALAGALLYASSPGSTIYSVAGMETAFFELMMVAACTAFLFQRDWLAAILAGFLPLVRPEGLMISGLVGIGLIAAKRNRVWPYGLVALLPLAAWGAWATSYYGTFIPHSVSAKQKFFTDPEFAVGASGFLRQWLYHYYSLFWANPIGFEGIRNTKYLAILLGAFPFAAGYLYQLGKSSVAKARSLPFVAAPGCYALVYVFGQAGLPFPWYFMPTVGLFVATSSLGLYSLAADLIARARSPSSPALAANGLLALTALLGLNHLARHYDWTPRFKPAALYTHVPQHREPVYAAAARWMDARPFSETNLVLCAEVGAIGYFCRYRVWDKTLTRPPWITEDGSQLVDKYRPRFITFMGLYPPVAELTEQPEVAAIGPSAVTYRKVFSENRNRASGYAARHNVLIYELED